MSGPSDVLIYLAVALGVLLLLLTGFVATRRRGRVEEPPESGAGATTLEPEAPPAEAPPEPVVEAPPVVEAVEAPPEPVVEAPPVVDAPSVVEAPPEPVVEAPPVVDAPPEPVLETPPVVEAPSPAEAPPVEVPKRGRVRSIGASLRGLFGRSMSDADWEELEEVLLRADVGLAATERIVGALRARKKIDDGIGALKEEILAILGDADRSLGRAPEGLSVWMFAGVNGTGKTTTIGKLAARLRTEGSTVVLAAADTFRAAADMQLERWAERSGADLIKHAHGADPAAVVFDGVKAAQARGADVLIVDTAGRLQTKKNLMEELSKIRRILVRESGEPAEVLLVLDATTGQNGLQQARAFAEAANVTGCVLTKLDGTAKGGIVIAVQQELGIPVKLVGLGEDIDDLAPFDPVSFVNDLVDA